METQTIPYEGTTLLSGLCPTYPNYVFSLHLDSERRPNLVDCPDFLCWQQSTWCLFNVRSQTAEISYGVPSKTVAPLSLLLGGFRGLLLASTLSGLAAPQSDETFVGQVTCHAITTCTGKTRHHCPCKRRRKQRVFAMVLLPAVGRKLKSITAPQASTVRGGQSRSMQAVTNQEPQTWL
eukprot:3841169-Amphidinium_carterae.1